MPDEQRHLPKQVDALKLAQQGIRLDGYVAVSALPRLAAALHSSDSILHPVLEFGIDDEGRQVVTGHLQASLPVTCQRCLDAMDYEVNSEFQCAFVTTDEQAKLLPAHLDPVMLPEGSSQANLYDMLEDEVLLNLPIAAFHDRCEGDGSTRTFGEEVSTRTSATKKPFAALGNLFKKDT